MAGNSDTLLTDQDDLATLFRDWLTSPNTAVAEQNSSSPPLPGSPLVALDTEFQCLVEADVLDGAIAWLTDWKGEVLAHGQTTGSYERFSNLLAYRARVHAEAI
jgi:hypothetical protein